MRGAIRSHSVRLLAGAVVLLLVAGGIAYATIPHSSGVYTACLTTKTGTVRLIDRLVEDGVVVRSSAAEDRRAVSLRLTPTGEAVDAAILSARQASLSAALDALTPEEAAQFGRLAEKVLRGLIRHEDHAYRACRLGDYRVCQDCPVDAELRAGATAAS